LFLLDARKLFIQVETNAWPCLLFKLPQLFDPSSLSVRVGCLAADVQRERDERGEPRVGHPEELVFQGNIARHWLTSAPLNSRQDGRTNQIVSTASATFQADGFLSSGLDRPACCLHSLASSTSAEYRYPSGLCWHFTGLHRQLLPMPGQPTIADTFPQPNAEAKLSPARPSASFATSPKP